VLLAARTLVRYAGDVTQDEFERNQMIQDAVMRQIQIIGEAASQISPGMRDEHAELPWHEMIGMRHRLVHDYSKIDVGRVWKAVKESVPDLIAALESVVLSDEGD